MKIVEHTYAASSITAKELDTATFPKEFIDQIIGAAYEVSSLIGNCAIVPTEEGSEADDAATALTRLMDEAWRLFGKPAPLDTEMVRCSLNKLHENRLEAGDPVDPDAADDLPA